jgi:hypothetical protein
VREEFAACENCVDWVLSLWVRETVDNGDCDLFLCFL